MGANPHPPLTEMVKTDRARRFDSVRRGLDYREVDDFLSAALLTMRSLEAERQSAEATVDVAPGEDETLAAPSDEDRPDLLSERLRRFRALVERQVELMVEEARRDASAVRSEAGTAAERIRSVAREEAERSVEEARTYLAGVKGDARVSLSDVAERRRAMSEELVRMQEQLARVAHDLDLVLNPRVSDDGPPTSARSVGTEDGS